jgi:transposase
MNKPPPPSPHSRHQQALQLKALYEDGATVRELAARSGLSHGTVLNRLAEAGTTMRTPAQPRRRARARQATARRRLAAELRARYDQGATVRELASPGRSARTVRRLLAEAGTPMRSPAHSHRMRSAAERQQLMEALRERYERGAPVIDLAAEAGRFPSTIYRLLREARTRSGPQHQLRTEDPS